MQAYTVKKWQIGTLEYIDMYTGILWYEYPDIDYYHDISNNIQSKECIQLLICTV